MQNQKTEKEDQEAKAFGYYYKAALDIEKYKFERLSKARELSRCCLKIDNNSRLVTLDQNEIEKLVFELDNLDKALIKAVNEANTYAPCINKPQIIFCEY